MKLNFSMQGFPYWEDGSDSTQYVVFSFEKGLTGQNYFSTDFHHPMKKFLSLPKFPNPLPPLGGEIYPLPI